MPSDLYNLNSAYGSEEELKHCIEEMRNHDILVQTYALTWYNHLDCVAKILF